jgi:hypothetical protein
MRIAVAFLLLAVPLALVADTPLPLMNDLSGNTIWNLRVSEDLVIWQDQEAIQILHIASGERKPPIQADLYELARTRDGYALLYHTGEQPHVAELDRSGNVVNDIALPLQGVTTAIAATSQRTLVVARSGEAVFLDALVPFRVLPAPTNALAAAAGTDAFLVAWTAEQKMWTARIDAEGQVSAPVLLGAGSVQPTIASNGSSFLILWWTEGAILRGSLDGRSSFVVAHSSGAVTRAYWDGTDYVVVFDVREVLYETRVSAGGAVRSARVLEGVTASWAVDAVPSRLAWVARHRCERGDTLMLRAGDGAAVPVSKGTPHQFAASLSRGTRIWAERSDRTRLYFGNGTLLSADAAYNVNAVIDASGPNALVVWTDERFIAGPECIRSLQGAIVTQQGAVLRTFRISDDVLGHAPPAVAWNGSHYAVVWERHSANVLVGVRVDPDGNVLDTPRTLTDTVERSTYVTALMDRPALVWDGERYLLVWGNLYGTYTPWYPDPPGRYDVRRRSLLHDLTPIGVVEIVDPIGTEPTAVMGPERGLIAWHHAEIRGVQLRIVEREGGARIIQRAIANVEGPLLSAPLGDEFVVVVGTGVFRVSGYAGVTPQEPLPDGAIPTDVEVNGESVSIAYTLGTRAYVRELTTEARPGRRRSVGR